GSLSRRLRGPEVSEGQVQHVRAAARAVVGGDGVVADQQREEEQAAGLDIVRVGAEGAEQRAQAIHAPVVDAPEPLGDRRVTPGPRASSSTRTASGPPAARARSPCSIHLLRGVRVGAAIVYLYRIARGIDNAADAAYSPSIQYCTVWMGIR